MCEYHIANNVCTKHNVQKPKITLKIPQQPVLQQDQWQQQVPQQNPVPQQRQVPQQSPPPLAGGDATYTKEWLLNELSKISVRVEVLEEQPRTVNNFNITVAPSLSDTDNYEQMINHMPKLLHNALSKHPANFISYMIKQTTCNPERPIYNSIRITNKRDNYAQISDGKKYVHVTKKKIISQLIDNKRGILQEYIDNNGDKYGEKILRRYQDYVDALDGDKKLQKELENDIICMLLDVSDLIGSEEWSKKLLDDLKTWGCKIV
jgi:hypothetical protein